jgi:hypothetical protein
MWRGRRGGLLEVKMREIVVRQAAHRRVEYMIGTEARYSVQIEYRLDRNIIAARSREALAPSRPRLLTRLIWLATWW